MDLFTILFVLLILFFIFDYNFCSKGLVFSIGKKSLRILKGCSSLERVYRSPLYLIHPVLQQLFVHVFYIYLEKKKAYVNHLLWEKTEERKQKKKNSNQGKAKWKRTLINIPQFIGSIFIQIKKWMQNILWQFFFFFIEYTRVYENICLKSNINTREVLSNNNFGVVIVDYYLPNCTVKKKKKKNCENSKKSSYEIDLYDLVNIKQEKKIKLILIDQKWKNALNIGTTHDPHVQFLYLQDTVLIQYFQFACIFKEEFLKNSSEPHVDGNDPSQEVEEKNYVQENITKVYHGKCSTQREDIALAEEVPMEEKSTKGRRSHIQGEEFNTFDERNEHQSSLSGKSSTVQECVDVQTGRKQNGVKVGSEIFSSEQKNNFDVDGNGENAMEDKIRTHMNKWKYKNVKGIIVIVPEIFYNYINVEEVKNCAPLYYVLSKDVKIDSFTVIAKLLGYICVHVHININFGLSIPFIFSNKNSNILNITNVESRNGTSIGGKLSGNVDHQYLHNCAHRSSAMQPQSVVSSYKEDQDRDLPLCENFLHDEQRRVPEENNKVANRLSDEVDNSNRKKTSYDHVNTSETLKNCANGKTKKDTEEVQLGEGIKAEFNAPLFSCPFSFYSDNYNDLNIAMSHFKSIFKNHNFVFLGFNDGTNILLNYFLEKIYKKKKNKTPGDSSKTPHFNLHSASPYKSPLLNYKAKGNVDLKFDPSNNHSKEKKKNSSKIGQANKSEEEGEVINQQSYKNNIMNIFFKEKKKSESEHTNGKNCFKEIKKWHIENLISDMKIRKGENSILQHDHVKDEQGEQASSSTRKVMEENPKQSYGFSHKMENLPALRTHGVDDKVDNHPVGPNHHDVENNRLMEGHGAEGKGEEQYEAEQDYSDYTDCHQEEGEDKSDDRYTQEGNIGLNNDSEIFSKKKKKKKHMEKIKNMKEKWKKKKIESFMNISKLNFFNKGKDIWGKSDFVKESEFNAVTEMEGDKNLYADMLKYNIKGDRNGSDEHSYKDGNPHCNSKDSDQRANPHLAHFATGEEEDLVGHDPTISLGTVRGERLHKEGGEMGSGQYDESGGEDKENRNVHHNGDHDRGDVHSRNDEEGPKPIEAPLPDFDTSSMKKKKKKMIKINVLDKFRNRETKIMKEGRQVEDASGISQKFRYSFFRIKNKITSNFKNPECKKTQHEKNIMDRDQMMINSFIKNKNVLLAEEESNYSDTSTCDEYGKKHTKEICLLINFSYNNMFDIFNYPDDFNETQKKKFSLIHTIFYSIHIFLKSFSTLIKQRYFFSCTSELTKFFKASLFHRVSFDTPNRRIPQGRGRSLGGTLLFGLPTNRKETEQPIKVVNNGGHVQCPLSRHCVPDLSLNNEQIPLDGIPNVPHFSNYPIKTTNDDENCSSLSFIKKDPNQNYKNETQYNVIGKKGIFLNIGENTGSSKDESINVKRISGNESILKDMNDEHLDMGCTHLTNDEDNHLFSTTNKSRESATNQSFFRGSHFFWQNHHDGSYLGDQSISSRVPILSGNGEVERSSKQRESCFHRNFFEVDMSLLCGDRQGGFKFPHDCEFANGVSPNGGVPRKDAPNYDCFIPLEGRTNEGVSPNGEALLKDERSGQQKEVNKIYGGRSPRDESFENAMKAYFNAKAIYDKWKIYFEENNFQGNAQEKFLFNLSFIYNVYNYLVWIYICTYFNEESYFNFCENQKFYQFMKKINILNEKKEFKRNSSFVSTSDMSIIIPHFFYPKDYKLLKVFLYMLQDSANQFISKNIQYFQFPLVFIFSSDSRNFHFTHFDIIKISKNNNLIYLLYKRGNEGLFLSGFRPYIWIHKVLFDFVESLFLSTFDD
ncbi:conserved Plasmodium protein, unknown function [Plasmodium knowlesi strain H]|uniref:Uncharacterized protein n=3 Tax=Plasmodium knowlesi TaxID=5850 RepID=A0A5K1UD18_PLAKH|nr:conserved Plasmodium protein, unknown function [Plasmodium knowlesi strain H]OTN64439.1 Uncharacterized protein PKNOH_S130184600 [Plasmodium knowlesi]CAA9989012.1 conserved Plasmodium protein, unknown function [Plasmodium knowlesi strain H]SBO24856.1 conserved Plasmodium protein, unknown function [Plasmodium knowlesi strain H]SBO27564.1 conserved Plasmodium protein, unknown function [Plasmodium knowlesi strain H]VVS78486.1 conserved Plasmodium protein, unknown function [Plasmodium knowlesi |eukprot:XP_002261360.1 hypothetical protein, conserved in Plasmodium species [Plasmodium knowlesi strain H]